MKTAKSITLDDKLIVKIKAKAKKEKRNFSNVVNYIVGEYFGGDDGQKVGKKRSYS